MASVEFSLFLRFSDGNFTVVALVCIFLYFCNRNLQCGRFVLKQSDKIEKKFASKCVQDGCWGHVIEGSPEDDAVW